MPRGRPRSAPGFVARNALEQLAYDIGQRLGQALIAGVSSKATAVAGPAKRGPGRPRRAGAACIVPGCDRRGVAKGLCPTHYRKARRLRVGAHPSAAQLNELAQDGRKTRFSKKAA